MYNKLAELNLNKDLNNKFVATRCNKSNTHSYLLENQFKDMSLQNDNNQFLSLPLKYQVDLSTQEINKNIITEDTIEIAFIKF